MEKPQPQANKGRPTRLALTVLGGMAFVAAVGPFLIPLPPLEDTLPPTQLADSDSAFAEVNGLQMHYKLAGESDPALVLMHGFASSLFTWQGVMAPLAQEGTVIAFDRPGFGLTERPMRGEWRGPTPYSPQAQADGTIALLEELGVERAVLIGHSAGGATATLTALRHPERVTALVLVAPAIHRHVGPPRWARFLLRTPQARRLGIFVARSLLARGERIIDRAWHDPARVTPQIVAGYMGPFRTQNWDRALWEFTLAAEPLGLPARLDEIDVPTLVITGDDDRIVPTAHSVHLATEVRDAKLVVIPACGHVPQEECPQVFLKAVKEFLEELAGAP